MTWVLILVLSNGLYGGRTATTADFYSQQACEAAAVRVREAFPIGGGIWHVCIDRGRP